MKIKEMLCYLATQQMKTKFSEGEISQLYEKVFNEIERLEQKIESLEKANKTQTKMYFKTVQTITACLRAGTPRDEIIENITLDNFLYRFVNEK
jgi:DNA replication initiation complex subunit (GINS family)